MMRKQLVFLLMVCATGLMGQVRTYVNSISPTRANVNATVTIAGAGFSSTASDMKVFFGGAEGTVTSATETVIEVTVPPGANYDEVMVINTSSGFAASSSQYFTLSFRGDTFDGQSDADISAVFDAIQDITTGQNLVYDICLCDFNTDGKVDIAMTAQEDGSTRAKRVIFQNNSTPSAISFSTSTLRNQPASHINCKDLNADGLPDLVASEINIASQGDSGTDDVEFYLNTSTSGGAISFGNPQFLPPPNNPNGNRRFPTQIELEDVDDDGRPDIIMSSRSDESVDIYLNTTSGGTLSFNPTPAQVTVTTGQDFKARGIKLGDLNGDVLVDIVVVPLNGDNVFVFQNKSTIGNVAFGEAIAISTGQNFTNPEIADLDGDGFAEIAVTVNNGGSPGEVMIIPNTTGTIGQNIALGTPVNITVAAQPWQLAAGDIDGDGDVDLAVTSISTSASTAQILNNESSAGNFSFNVVSFTVDQNSRDIDIGDINGDAKPDLIITTDSRTLTAGNLSILANRNCATPSISPSADIYCPGNQFLINATKGVGLTYQWSVDGTTQTDTDSEFDISTFNTDISVQVTSTTSDGSCVRTSSAANFTVNTNTPANPTFTVTENPVCLNGTISLNSDITADEYFWTGPNGFVSSLRSPSLTASAASAGKYSLVIKQSDGCKSQPAENIVEVITTPFPKVINQNADAFCLGGSASLITSNYSGYSYQWNINGSPISGSTGTGITVDASGNYSLTITSQANTSCSDTSLDYQIQEVDPPVPDPVAVDEICIDLPVTFQGDTTFSDPNFPISFAWDIRDSSGGTLATDNNQNTSFTFTSSGTFTALLTASYDDIANCSGQDTHQISVRDVPVIPITAPTTVKCPEDSVLLMVPDTLQSYLWSTGDTDNDAYATTTFGQDTVEVFVSMTDDVGCVINDTISVNNFTDGGLSITSDLTIDENSVLTIPPGTQNTTVQLQANGGSGYLWDPGIIFDDSTATNVTVFPRQRQTIITLSGEDINGCDTTAMITLVNDNIFGRKSFSPNGDMMGFECWEILNASTLTDCTVLIFDRRGRNILRASAPFPDDCIWDGNDESGKQLPVGVYYYVLKCDEGESSRKGSILLAR